MRPLMNLYGEIVSLKNLFEAAKKTLAQGRRFRGEGSLFKFNLEREILKLHRQLTSGRYMHGKYRLFSICDPKPRAIAAAPLKDRVLHHAVHDVIEPQIDRMFIHDSYACRKGKGTHKALDRAHHFLRANRYAIHLDVQNYFQSIDHTRLKQMLVRYIGDADALRLLEMIVDSTDYLARNRYSREGRRRISNVVTLDEQGFLPGLGVESGSDTRIRGLPLGNLTSQFFANLYLNELDQHIKHELKVRYYVRYMDDMLLFSDDKGILQAWEQSVREFARNRLGLELHPTGGPRPVTAGLSFLGFRLFPHCRKLKRTSVIRFVRRMKGYTAACENPNLSAEDRSDLREKVQVSAQSFNAHARTGNTFQIRKILYERFPIVDFSRMAGMKQAGVEYAMAAHS